MIRLSVDFRGFLYVDGRETGAHLTKKQAEFFKAIMRRSTVASREYLLACMYLGADEPEVKILDVVASYVRRKLGEHSGAISTVWGRGYCRGDGYEMPPESEDHVEVSVPFDLVERLIMLTNEDIDTAVAKLLSKEVVALEAAL